MPTDMPSNEHGPWVVEAGVGLGEPVGTLGAWPSGDRAMWLRLSLLLFLFSMRGGQLARQPAIIVAVLLLHEMERNKFRSTLSPPVGPVTMLR